MSDRVLAMTTDEFLEVVEWLEDRWPASSSKSWATADKLYEDFQHYTVVQAMSAARRLFEAGSQTVPSPSKLIAMIREVAGASGIVYEGPHECALSHVFPYYLYGGLFASERGPGEKACAVAGCEVRRPCHDEECRTDAWYARELRPATAEELEYQQARRSA